MAIQVFQRDERIFKTDMLWLMICSALVFMMVISLCLVYSGLGRPLFAITHFKQPIITGAIISFQWYLWGYTLTFSEGTMWFSSQSTSNALQMPPSSLFTTDGSSTQSLPELSFALFQGMFASFTAALVCAGTMQKMHSARYLLFISIWSTCIYSPIARWSWYSDGWSHKLGSMDFAGGTPVHIASGAAVAAMALFFFFEANGFHKAVWHLVGVTKERVGHSVLWVLGMWARRTLFSLDPWRPRAEPGDILPDRRPEVYDVNQAVLGTGLLWFGWFGFNGGSALGINRRAVSAVLSTHVAACSGGVTAVFLNWTLKQRTKKKQGSKYNPNQFRKLTAIHFCDGAIAGLVSITPGSGYVPVSKSALFGLVSSAIVMFMKPDSSIFLRDDELKVFLVHTIAGFIGMFMTGWFASKEVVEADGFSTWTHRSISQRLGIQMSDAAAGFAYSFLGTIAILMLGKLLMFAVAVIRNRRLSLGEVWNQANVFKFDNNGNPAIEDRLRAADRHEWARDDAEDATEMGPVGNSHNAPVENGLEHPRTSLSSSRAPQLESIHYSQVGSLNHSQLGSHHSQGGSLHHSRSQELPTGWRFLVLEALTTSTSRTSTSARFSTSTSQTETESTIQTATTSESPSITPGSSDTRQSDVPPPTTLPSSESLTAAAKAGIAVGAVFGALLLVAVAVMGYKLKEYKQVQRQNPENGSASKSNCSTTATEADGSNGTGYVHSTTPKELPSVCERPVNAQEMYDDMRAHGAVEMDGQGRR